MSTRAGSYRYTLHHHAAHLTFTSFPLQPHPCSGETLVLILFHLKISHRPHVKFPTAITAPPPLPPHPPSPPSPALLTPCLSTYLWEAAKASHPPQHPSRRLRLQLPHRHHHHHQKVEIDSNSLSLLVEKSLKMSRRCLRRMEASPRHPSRLRPPPRQPHLP